MVHKFINEINPGEICKFLLKQLLHLEYNLFTHFKPNYKGINVFDTTLYIGGLYFYLQP